MAFPGALPAHRLEPETNKQEVCLLTRGVCPFVRCPSPGVAPFSLSPSPGSDDPDAGGEWLELSGWESSSRGRAGHEHADLWRAPLALPTGCACPGCRSAAPREEFQLFPLRRAVCGLLASRRARSRPQLTASCPRPAAPSSRATKPAFPAA